VSFQRTVNFNADPSITRDAAGSLLRHQWCNTGARLGGDPPPPRWITGWSAAATFEGELSNVTAGKGVVRYSR